MSAAAWDDKFELLDGSYLLSDIQDCFRNIIKKHEKMTDNTLIIILLNKKLIIIIKIYIYV